MTPAELRRRLEAKGVTTRLPQCPACGKQTDPTAFDTRLGICRTCEREHAKAIEQYHADVAAGLTRQQRLERAGHPKTEIPF